MLDSPSDSGCTSTSAYRSQRRAGTYDRTSARKTIWRCRTTGPQVVSTVADRYGSLPQNMSEAVRLKPSDALSPYEAALRNLSYFERIPEVLGLIRPAFRKERQWLALGFGMMVAGS